ncbi:CPBP family intramembrane metalloprotease [Pedobacter sp. PAMC26386]|nr:CPBP family intramembrane metalloprotease [Pedobacter sp. PAMC26386]
MENVQTSSRKAIFTFLFFILLLSSVVWVLTIHAGVKTGSFGNRVYGYGIMWCPALAAYITCKILGRNISDLAWQWGKSKYILWSYLIPLLYALAAYTIVWSFGGGGFYNQTFLAKMQEDLGRNNIPSGLFIILFCILEGSIGLLPSIATALGEEIGWRGFLLPEIATSTNSYTKTSLIMGLIWAIWHYPLLIFGNYNAGAPSWYSLITFTLGIISVSFIFTWFRLKSNSLWTGVMLHASHNLFIQAVFNPITIENKNTKYFTGEFGLVLPIISFLLAIYFWSRRKELAGISS